MRSADNATLREPWTPAIETITALSVEKELLLAEKVYDHYTKKERLSTLEAQLQNAWNARRTELANLANPAASRLSLEPMKRSTARSTRNLNKR